MKDGRLPDLKAWARAFAKEVGKAFVLRGVEATVDGWLIRQDGKLAVRLDGCQTVLALEPLGRLVQWDVAARREQKPTASEKKALERLAASWTGAPRRVRLVGPLREAPGTELVLQVRAFTERPRR
jgi:hypothetical protein